MTGLALPFLLLFSATWLVTGAGSILDSKPGIAGGLGGGAGTSSSTTSIVGDTASVWSAWLPLLGGAVGGVFLN